MGISIVWNVQNVQLFFKKHFHSSWLYGILKCFHVPIWQNAEVLLETFPKPSKVHFLKIFPQNFCFPSSFFRKYLHTRKIYLTKSKLFLILEIARSSFICATFHEVLQPLYNFLRKTHQNVRSNAKRYFAKYSKLVMERVLPP
jgi:hypothetical protein